MGCGIAGWYVLVFGCARAAFSVAAWFALRGSICDGVDDELRDRVRGVTSFMNHQIASLSVPEIRDEFREHSVLGPGGDLFQVCDQDGQWLYRSVPLESNNVSIAAPGTLAAPRCETSPVQGHF